MPWVYFAISAACFAVAFRTHSLGLAALTLLLALGFLLAGALSLVSARIQSRSQNTAAMIGPEQAAAIRRRAATHAAPSTAVPPLADDDTPDDRLR
jgi:hypothetical protein